MADKAKSSAFWWEDYDNEQPSYELKTISIEAPEVFDHPCGFIKLRERHRVKAPSRVIDALRD